MFYSKEFIVPTKNIRLTGSFQTQLPKFNHFEVLGGYTVICAKNNKNETQISTKLTVIYRGQNVVTLCVW